MRPIQVSAKMVILLRSLRFDLDVDRDRLTDAGDRLSRLSEHQIEVAPGDCLCRHRPARVARVVHRRK